MIAALSLGLFVGIVLGVVGGGGSIIAVPALVYGMGMSPAEAIPTSLLVVGISSLAALIPRLREGLNWPVVLIVGAAGIPAAWGGTAVGRLLDPNILMLAFAVIMVFAGIRMLMRVTETEGSCSTGPNRAFRSCAPKAVGVGILVGFLTGLLGVGGGFLITPALTLFLGLRMKQAVGSSLAIIVINSAAGFGAHAAGFTIDWPSVLSFAVPAILGSLVAARLARHLNDKHIRISFAVLIFAVAAWVTAGTVTA
ncbi:sulfite exporter TauE/SafE family protein [Pseudarthrobacter sp. AL07]|uniref:sulfite exporter TauE/SafE family protein n=1 Tax=unclassified Pseudarthrobacter TaxID=2647000 RepID=UPI00249A4915|nr:MULTISPECIES: sulfite exporter TauE/SafE family protein [unclassified Pseudarthrobacter]MDI3196320.1 sulfite exporter TauE/SafE family protein [Pseudarthrobacter sp. AL20]MDI3210380.1 sulfite exporter TauE/SafE family protein [Pseudarthrobacter sp. AL07]